ncbi:uncharacterized protein [Amphiura filiformis]|uniref:uncharacterized protein isoform X2 n=1 Tax=Amphiura filiformis TaxID=82378 RepID=UPI003B2227C8
MANPDGAKARNEDANMAMTLASAGVRNDQEYSSDPDVEDISQSAANNSKKKSCFQITSVKASEIPQNDDNDSIDDMDESRAEDFSSSELLDISKSSIQTDLDRQDIRENSHSTPKKVTTNNVTPANSSIVNVNVNQAVPSNGNLGRRTGNEPPHELLHQISDPGKTTISDSGKTTNGSKLGNGNLEPVSRFKVVKVPRIEPFTRGRWKCRDFETQQPSQQSSADVVNRTEQQNKDVKSGESSAASSVHGENPNNENPLLGGENSTTGKSEQSKNNYSNTGRSGPGLKSHRPSQSSITHDDRGSLEDTIKETLNVDLEDPHAVDGDGDSDLLSPLSTSAGGAIDNKIEQAMDLVKSHLLFAVREEVEVLKVQIKELAEKNEQLQRENAMLRQAPGAPMAMPQQTLPQQQPTALPKESPTTDHIQCSWCTTRTDITTICTAGAATWSPNGYANIAPTISCSTSPRNSPTSTAAECSSTAAAIHPHAAFTAATSPRDSPTASATPADSPSKSTTAAESGAVC